MHCHQFVQKRINTIFLKIDNLILIISNIRDSQDLYFFNMKSFQLMQMQSDKIAMTSNIIIVV